MGRIRTIKPEFPHSESMGRCSRDARLLFVMLWTIVDDVGRTRAASRMLASLLFPYDDDAPKLIGGWLTELVENGCIVLYEVGGAHFLEIRNWSEHQKIDRPSPSKFPPFVEPSRALANPREASSSPRECSTLDLDQDQDQDQGPVQSARAREPRPEELEPDPDREPDPKPKRDQKRAVAIARPPDVPEQLWDDWLAHRRRKKADVTQTAIDGIRREAAVAGMTFPVALQHSITQGWQGFRADWVARDRGAGGSRSSPPRRQFQESPVELRDLTAEYETKSTA